jgi:hypothetical protein
MLARAEPRAAAVDGRAVSEALGPDSAADAIAGFEHDDGTSRLRNAKGGRQAGVASSDDANVRFEPLHGALAPCVLRRRRPGGKSNPTWRSPFC